MMNVIYEGTDITDSIDVHKADIIDNAGGVADSVELTFSDTQGLWSKWKPKKGDMIEIKESGFSSGLMFIDHIEQQRGLFIIKGLSIPLESKTERTKAWEKIRFLDIANEIANRYNFKLETYNIQNYRYERVEQIEQTDFEFLALKCMLEGYMLKINNQKVIIYDEQYMENQSSVLTINSDDIDGNYSFRTISTGLFNSCIVSFNSKNSLIKSEFKPLKAPLGPILKKSIYVSSQGEAERYSRGFLRFENKKETTGSIQIKLNTGLAAGCNVNISDIGLFDGKYFVEKTVHKLVENKTIIKLRKALEGY